MATARTTRKNKSLDIPQEVVSRARTRRRRTSASAEETARRVFAYAKHPPAVMDTVPKGLAMDEAISLDLYSTWAVQNSINQMFTEGMAFLGYPMLSELAQRPEYRVISETIAEEMTRKWIKITAKGDKDKTAEISQIEDEFKRLGVRDLFKKAAEHDGLFGRGHIYLDTGDTENGDELKTPIGDGHDSTSQQKVSQQKKIQRLSTVEAVWVYPANYNSNNPLSPEWFRPEHWLVQGKQVHRTRLLTFIGREVPDMLKPAYSFGGLSMSQMAKPYVDNWLRTRQSVADLIHNFSIRGVKTNLSEQMMMEGGAKLFNRIDLFNALVDNQGTMVLNKDEDFFFAQASLGTLDHLQAQTQEHMSSVSRIPLVKLLGVTPSGLNASSDGEIRVFYDHILAYEEKLFASKIRSILGFVQLGLFGKVDPDITFIFEPLWEMSELEKAQVKTQEAQTDKTYIDGNVLSPIEVRKRIADDPETPYASLDIDQPPEMTDQQKSDNALKLATPILQAYDSGLLSAPRALEELRAQGLFETVTDDDIEKARELEEAPPPEPMLPDDGTQPPPDGTPVDMPQ